MNALHTAIATAQSGRSGRTRTDDGALDLTLSVPQPLGPGGPGTNPEQLFAAGFAACFAGALQLVAKERGVATGPVAITAYVSIGKLPRGFGLAVKLEGRLPEVDDALALSLMEDAEGICPYANAIRGNVAVQLVVASTPITAEA